MQTKALGTLSVYREPLFWHRNWSMAYLSDVRGLSTSSMATAVPVGGIVLLVISVPMAGILYVGISRGKKNVEKIIKAIRFVKHKRYLMTQRYS